MEQIQDYIVHMIENFGEVPDMDNFENIMLQRGYDTLEPSLVGKSAAEITAIRNMLYNNVTLICNRLKIAVESKLLSEREFFFYKLIGDEDICPKLRSWNRDNGQFLIKHKKHDIVEVLTNDKKESVLELINKLHKMGIYHGNITKNNIVYNEYEGVKLAGFSDSLWIDQIDDQFLSNNLYGIPCTTIDELLNLELKMVEEMVEEMNEK